MQEKLYVFSSSTSLDNADVLYRQVFKVDGYATLFRKECGDYYLWSDGVWADCRRSRAESVLANRLVNARVRAIRPPLTGGGAGAALNDPQEREEQQPLEWSASKVVALVDGMGQLHPYEEQNLETSQRYIGMANGMYDVDTGELLDWSPRFGNQWRLPFAYQPGAKCPTFDSYLDSITKDMPQTKRFLLQWLGYLVSGRTDLQKGVYLMGATRSGKSTFADICAALVGESNTAAPRGDVGQFSTKQWEGKSLVAFSDVRSVNDPRKLAEILLQVIGNDRVTVEGKGKDERTVRLHSRVMVCSNTAIPIYDIAGVAQNRFIGVYLPISFRGKEDSDLGRRIAAEMPGIFNRALDGLADLEKQGTFTEPEQHGYVMDRLRIAGSAVSEFYSEALEVAGIEHVLSVQDIRTALDAYLTRQGITKVPREEKTLNGIEGRCDQLGYEVSKPKDDDGKSWRCVSGVKFTAQFATYRTTHSDNAERARNAQVRRGDKPNTQPRDEKAGHPTQLQLN
ncbi:phage/plasmid primase, P4 family [Corynebacterium amycolatum]|uniref:DNA primase family protein n=1 Tax=Corynebacterium amycolatum TaxID=43765 RepID=UPI00254C622D|nr:phage/plasmid primase, P4 family [Corynebacterium amycolatum]MDK8819823.1 phage/plasmid primase, P4 family [Corynebacterium amycolatum]